MLSELLSIIWKNFKVVFRTPSLLFLVIIGPLSLILLVGSAFSSNTPEGAEIGVVYKGNVPALDLDVRTINYRDDGICENHLVRGKVEACVYISRNSIEDETMDVEIIFDDTRPQITQIVINKVQGFLGLASEEITLTSTTQLINELNNFISFARSTENDLDDFIDEVQGVQSSLNEAENSLQFADSELRNQELELIQTRNELNDIDDEKLEDDENEAYTNMLDSLNQADNELANAIYIIGNDNITDELRDIRNDINDARNDLYYYHNQFSKGINALRRARTTVENSLNRIDNLQTTVQNELSNIRNSQQNAREAKQRLEVIKSDLTSRMPEQDFSESFAKKVATPIEVELISTLPYEPSNIQKLFPLIAATVAMFISLLLGNILTLSEIHSPAYLRTVISPMSRFWFILGIFITNLILVSLQMGVLFNTGWANFGINIMTNFWYVFGFVILEAMIFTLLGMLIAYLVNSEQTSILITTFVILFLFLISDAVFPVEIMPAFARFISSINPLMIHKEFFRFSLFYSPNILDLGWQLVLSVGYLVAGFIFVTLSDFGFKRRFLK